MIKKACIGLTVLSLIVFGLQLPGGSRPTYAADDRITPQDLAIFAVIAGAAFFVITYFLAGLDRGKEKSVGWVEEERRAGYVENHPNMSPDLREAILRGELLVDMTTEQVIASWGEPRRKEILDSVGRVRERWLFYKRHSDYSFTTYYLIFVNGYLKEW